MNVPISVIYDNDNTSPVRIHQDARISPKAVVGRNCSIGPFAVIGEGVVLGECCTIYPHAVVNGPTVMGDGNEVHSFACIGGPPQDLRHKGELTELFIGTNNIFREYVTVNRGTVHGGGRTLIGDGNLFMAYVHIAHDCKVANRTIFANAATLAGHSTVEDFAVFGGGASLGTFLRVGESAMAAAGAMIERDIPPFCIAAGDRARLRAVNRVGLTRRMFDDPAKRQIKAIFKELKNSSKKLQEIVMQFRNRDKFLTPEASRMLSFLESATRGVVR